MAQCSAVCATVSLLGKDWIKAGIPNTAAHLQPVEDRRHIAVADLGGGDGIVAGLPKDHAADLAADVPPVTAVAKLARISAQNSSSS